LLWQLGSYEGLNVSSLVVMMLKMGLCGWKATS
jgi:hypothetical protein